MLSGKHGGFMSSELYDWATEELYELLQDLKWFNAGAKLWSPSGDDITIKKVERLNARVHKLKEAMRKADNA
jgi:hypothetical protein